MISPRLSDWETRFAAFLAAADADARAGQKNYCALFAAEAVEAITGTNPAQAFRGRYAETAKRLEATIDELFPPRPVAFARRGDLAWNGAAVGVVIGSEALFVGETPAGEPGLVRVPRDEWEKAWTVG